MKFINTGFAIAIAVAGFAFTLNASQPALAQAEDKVVFKVNGQEVRASEIAFARDEVLPHLGGLPAKARYPFIVDYLIERHLMAQAAVSAKVNKSDAYRKRLRYYQVKALREAYFAEHIRPLVSKKQVQETYEREKKTAQSRDRARVRHIVVATQKEADEIFAKASKGENFEQMAKERSTDESAAQGGDLGYFFAEEMVPEFSEVVFKLNRGQLGGPVKTKWGWHVIQMLDKQTVGPKRFEDVEEGLTAILLRQKVQDEIARLKKISKIEYLDPDLVKLQDRIQKRIDQQKKLQEQQEKQEKQSQ